MLKISSGHNGLRILALIFILLALVFIQKNIHSFAWPFVSDKSRIVQITGGCEVAPGSNLLALNKHDNQQVYRQTKCASLAISHELEPAEKSAIKQPDKKAIEAINGRTNTLRSEPFVAYKDGLQFVYNGSQNLPPLIIRSVTGDQIKLLLRGGGQARYHNQRLPNAWLGKSVTVSLEQGNNNKWAGLGSISNSSFSWITFIGWLNLLVILLAVQMVLLGLYLAVRQFVEPMVAMVAFPILLGSFGFAAFWAYLVSHSVGLGVSLLAAIISVWGYIRAARTAQPGMFVDSAIVTLPIFAYTLFVLTISYFPYTHDIAVGGDFAANRWRSLPVDAFIPKILADKLWFSQAISPFIPTWLASDRPPLQAGINLLLYPMFKSALSYQVFSTYLQAVVLLPFFVLIRRFSLSQHSFIILLGFMLSGFVALNSLFVWPKLISACYVLIVYLLLFSPEFDRLKGRALFIGLATALSMLSHGGALFGLLAIFILAALRGPWVSFKKTILPSGLISLVLYAPWVFFQRLIDPPGDRLVKWHFGGHPAITEESTLTVISNAYAGMSLSAWMAGRVANFQVIFERAWQIIYWIPEAFKSPFHFPFYTFLHDVSFANFFFSFWFLSPLYALILLGLKSTLQQYKPLAMPAIEHIRPLTYVLGLAMLIWVCLMFLPKSTSIHQSSYFFWVGFYVLSCAVGLHIHRVYLYTAISLNVLLFYQFYVMDYVYYDRNGSSLYLVYVTIASVVLLLGVWGYSRRSKRFNAINLEGN